MPAEADIYAAAVSHAWVASVAAQLLGGCRQSDTISVNE